MAKYKKRADGRYATSVTYLGKKYYFTAKSSAELDRKVQEFKIAKRSGTYSSGMLLKDWCDHYLVVQHAAIRKNSWATIESHIRVHIKPELGDFPLCNLQPANIRDFIAALSARLASRTVEHIYVTLKALLTQAVIDGVLAKHPMLQIKKPKVTRKREWVALTQAQVTKLLSVITDQTHQLLIKLAATSGMRRSEILGLRYQDVDLERCTFTVRQTNLRTKGGGEIGASTKTEDSWRTVSLPKAILPLIKAQGTDKDRPPAGHERRAVAAIRPPFPGRARQTTQPRRNKQARQTLRQKSRYAKGFLPQQPAPHQRLAPAAARSQLQDGAAAPRP